MAGILRNEENDPDYSEFRLQAPINHAEIKLSKTKDRTVEKIDKILRHEFKTELEIKEHEIALAERKINQTKTMLDRLRAYVLASYYGSGENLEPGSRAVWKRRPKRKRNAVGVVEGPDQQVIVKAESKSDEGDSLRRECGGQGDKAMGDAAIASRDHGEPGLTRLCPGPTPIPPYLKPEVPPASHRFYCTRQIVVGNVSKYLLADTRKENDKSTHKWMVYVRGAKHDSDVSDFVESVSFFLHPSYIPNDIVHVRKAPFQLTRRGWGEFPVRVQLNFVDKRNKRVDVIHNLKLDKTYTGLQTLGAETVVDLELHRHAMAAVGSEPGNFAKSARGFVRTESDPGTLVGVCNSERRPASVSRSSSHGLLLKPSSSVPSSPVPFLEPCFESRRLNIIKSESVSVASSCVSSAVVSPCPSPTMQLNVGDVPDAERSRESSRSTLLHQLVRRTPLYDEKRDIGLHPFAARSFEQFSGWSVSKRRASEWQRACFVRRLFEDLLSRGLISLEVPTTKEILLWCRNNGYSPNEKSSMVWRPDESPFCVLCGLLGRTKASVEWCAKCLDVQSDPMRINSRTSSESCLADFQGKEKSFAAVAVVRSIAESEDAFVDVLTLNDDAPSPSASGCVFEEIPASTEMNWVYDVCAEVGLHLPSMNLDGVRAPVASAMCLEAAKRFVGELLRRSYSNSAGLKRSSLDPCVVTPFHVYSAINNTDRYDFLTGMCLGVAKEVSISTRNMKAE